MIEKIGIRVGVCGSIADIDVLLKNNEEKIINLFPKKVNGLDVRVSSAMKILSPDGKDVYVYKRTSDGALRRGEANKYDTPKGRVKFTDNGKWNIDEYEINAMICNVTIATEQQLEGQFEEFVFMVVINIKVDEASYKNLTDNQNNVPEDMGDVAGYEWVSLLELNHTNAMTKLL